MFKFEYGDNWWYPANDTYHGYTKLQASEKAKEVIMSVKDLIYPGWLKEEPWLDAYVVMDICCPGGEESFIDLAKRGKLKTQSGVLGYEWRITN